MSHRAISSFIGLGKTVLDTADSTSYEDLLGTEVEFEDFTPGSGAARNTGLKTKYVLVRNSSGATLLPGRACVWRAGYRGRAVDGMVTTTAGEIAGIVDPFLPSSGVGANHLFLLAIGGPSFVRTDIAASANNVFSEGSLLVGLTAATSQATTSGRVSVADFTGATVNLANQLLNGVARAMSANTTAQTNRLVRAFLLLK